MLSGARTNSLVKKRAPPDRKVLRRENCKSADPANGLTEQDIQELERNAGSWFETT